MTLLVAILAYCAVALVVAILAARYLIEEPDPVQGGAECLAMGMFWPLIGLGLAAIFAWDLIQVPIERVIGGFYKASRKEPRITRECDASERLRLEQERSLNHKRDQALARAKAAEARLAEVEKARREIVDSVTGTLVHPEQARRIEAAVAALDRALNETTSQEES